MVFRTDDDGLDSRRYNAPIAPEIAAIIAEESEGKLRDIKLCLREGGFPNIADKHQRYDPLSYSLIRPMGDPGRPLGAPNELGPRNLTPSKFASYRPMLRAARPDRIYRFGRLFRQYVCDQWSKVDMQRKRYIRFRQETLRSSP